jgi:hypothetical protein
MSEPVAKRPRSFQAAEAFRAPGETSNCGRQQGRHISRRLRDLMQAASSKEILIPCLLRHFRSVNCEKQLDCHPCMGMAVLRSEVFGALSSLLAVDAPSMS